MTIRSYDDEAIKLSKAVDIAIESFEKYPPEIWTKDTFAQVVKCYREFKENALNPEPRFRKIASLKYTIENVFTYFQESNGKDVEYFWRKIKEQELDYVREDRLWKIIKRGKIKTRIEFEYITDIIVGAEQERRITESEAEKLASMIGEFESRKSK
jgi:hypothetical protein